VGIQGPKHPEADKFLHVKGDLKKIKIMNISKQISKGGWGGAGSAFDLERIIDPKYVPVYVICITTDRK
jgi:hypothetical protein